MCECEISIIVYYIYIYHKLTNNCVKHFFYTVLVLLLKNQYNIINAVKKSLKIKHRLKNTRFLIVCISIISLIFCHGT